ncbi:sterol 3-beta-glucosyltransferase UGT80A2 isoform X1 [Prunus yedoensis var. nudiflora]|uniref:Sterol 3-beta-glucosyltransferase UGT80A2 isoform X1 n=1 Tax=Prunus yedoensis var. nudiflora TaxID=2094558 RepID=A0A314ZBX2_PRUYE|nr:sterol 3-beta-glucosyltransferase UGT80A2 isoform X1 [Prunus yedoensis var. nudiflora]
MAESPANDRRSHSGSSSDTSVYFEAEVPPPSVDNATASSGIVERDLQIERTSGESSAVGTSSHSSSSSSQLTASARLTHNQSLAAILAKLFDHRTPFRKKRKYINRLARVQNDGTVQFDVPGDIKPQQLDFGTGVVHSEPCKPSSGETEAEVLDVRPLQIVMLIVGTRGDVQPFVAIGKRLQEYGHRVRLATHANFKDFVLTAGLEFFPLGGDPKVLAGYMVKNKGFLPSGPSEISIQRNQIKEIIFSLLPACKEPDPDSEVPFKADAIISNPPAYGHSDVAEALKVPLHIFFTMPWTSPPDVPYYGYIWSPHLVPKPKDWGPKVDVVGFCFLDLASNYEPPDSLVEWLEAGEQPVYIGFGSLPLEEPEKMTNILSSSSGNNWTERHHQPRLGWPWLHIFLFSVAEPSDSVHHGGAGTTAAGLKAACPTTIVPFFGDQPFWGERVHARGVGPAPIPADEFSLEKLVDAIHFMLDPKVKERAVEIAKAMDGEDGVTGAVNAFHRHFPQNKSEDKPESLPARRGLFSIRRCFGHSSYT